MAGKLVTMKPIETLRHGILGGERVELPSVQRQYLERGNPLVPEFTLDEKHRPLSTNASRHLQLVRTIANDTSVALHTFLPLKKSPTQGKDAGHAVLLVTVDQSSRFSVHTLDGDVILKDFDLGHGEGRRVTDLELSPNQDNHFIMTADDSGVMRVHNLKVMAKKEEKKEPVARNDTANGTDDAPAAEEKEEDNRRGKGGRGGRGGAGAAPAGKRQLVISTNFSCSFSVPPAEDEGEHRLLTSMMPMDRGAQTYFIAGDSLGGISVFFRNGTMKGRVMVTDDPGGIRGLRKGQSQTVLFFSSHAFGFFSTSQLDVQYPPCDGWESPLYDVALDSGGGSRVILALEDGDILVFSTTRGKSKACDLTRKVPHVSRVPYKIQIYRGHIMGLSTAPLEGEKSDYLRELFFFNLAALDAGYGAATSKVITLQAHFKPKQPLSLVLHAGGAAGGSSSSSSSTPKAMIAFKMANSPGIDLWELTLKQPTARKGGGGGGSDGSSGDGDSGSWLDWFPKIGVFGIAMIGVVIWNAQKVTAQKRGGGGGDKFDDFDEDYFKERLKERRLKKKEDGGGPSALGGLGGDDPLNSD